MEIEFTWAVKGLIQFLGLEALAEEFEVSESTIKSWAKCIKPARLIQKQVLNLFQDAQKNARLSEKLWFEQENKTIEDFLIVDRKIRCTLNSDIDPYAGFWIYRASQALQKPYQKIEDLIQKTYCEK